MGIREAKVEKYLDDEVKKLGGITRKWVSPGRDGVPDRIVFVYGSVFFVEVKTDDGRLSPEQVREHDRLRHHGAEVVTVNGFSGVNQLVNDMKRYQSTFTRVYI